MIEELLGNGVVRVTSEATVRHAAEDDKDPHSGQIFALHPKGSFFDDILHHAIHEVQGSVHNHERENSRYIQPPAQKKLFAYRVIRDVAYFPGNILSEIG